jgi:BirA family biotin operon repressor/biotin-[acetyl-CoA-carboxylase] ligase
LESIAAELDCSPDRVVELAAAMADLDIETEFVVGEGYRLTHPLELLDQNQILAQVNEPTRDKLSGLRVIASLDSTNLAIQKLPIEDRHAMAIAAEHQTAGRGRRGRNWHSPFGRNLYLSLGWSFPRSSSSMGCLSLVVALAAARALSKSGLSDHRIKWPNDLLLHGQKLGGCLVESQLDTNGCFHIVAGVGLNVHMPEAASASNIDQPWTDLNSHVPGSSRNQLLTGLLDELVEHLTRFEADGFEPFRAQWESMDGLKGQRIDVVTGTGKLKGISAGIDGQGALLLKVGEKMHTLHSGDASLSRSSGT